ncbi:phage antirepressor [Microbacterium sp. UBA837]|uniref:phage antirepressor n=1 Tax=Microbacterium sp. UBA837 TaxID=1946956 RepID=UPI002601304E|nr:phage antirepressor [Microbacterium sp. UBA837]|tara:strand:+ start:714 stop:1472 length:759 start_codon:yes stop_codon:yes gene_type:complete
MTALDVFQYDGADVRTVVIDGEPWFVARDVAAILGYANAADAISKHCKGVANHYPLQTAGGAQHVRIISEPDMLRLIVNSKLPAAERFEQWVFEDVLPTIRKTGRYGSDVDMLTALPSSKLLMLAAEAAERAEAAEAKIALDAPKVLFADSVAASEDSVLVARLANILKQNGLDIGQNRLFERLREDGYLCKGGSNHNRPTQRAMDRGLFEVIERTVHGSDGSPRIKFTPKVTGKGQNYFVNRYASETAVAS